MLYWPVWTPFFSFFFFFFLNNRFLTSYHFLTLKHSSFSFFKNAMDWNTLDYRNIWQQTGCNCSFTNISLASKSEVIWQHWSLRGIQTHHFSPNCVQMQMMAQALTGSSSSAFFPTILITLLSPWKSSSTFLLLTPLHHCCSSFILLRAEPALNHSICVSLKVWFSSRVSSLPSLCFTTALRGCENEKKRQSSHCGRFSWTAVGTLGEKQQP